LSGLVSPAAAAPGAVKGSWGCRPPVHNAGVEPAFVLHLPPESGRLAFGPIDDPYGDGYVGRFEVELTDDGLTATTTATIGVFAPGQLDEFLDSLADDWRGWDGVRRWHSLNRELVIEATHDRTRRVVLEVTVQPDALVPPWSAQGRFEIEPGEQLAAIVGEVAAWLGPYATRHRSSS
jgi:hypothetical protein